MKQLDFEGVEHEIPRFPVGTRLWYCGWRKKGYSNIHEYLEGEIVIRRWNERNKQKKYYVERLEDGAKYPISEAALLVLPHVKVVDYEN